MRTVHSGRKPYKCPHCDYASAFRGNLNTHIKVSVLLKEYKYQGEYVFGSMYVHMVSVLLKGYKYQGEYVYMEVCMYIW